MKKNLLLDWKYTLQPEFLCGPSCVLAANLAMKCGTIQKVGEFQSNVFKLTNKIQANPFGKDGLRNTVSLNEIFQMTKDLYRSGCSFAARSYQEANGESINVMSWLGENIFIRLNPIGIYRTLYK